jgi:pyridoxine 5'-phosphate synthase PdxJ
MFEDIVAANRDSRRFARARAKLQRAYDAYRTVRLAFDAANGHDTTVVASREIDVAAELAELDVAHAIARFIEEGLITRAAAWLRQARQR